MSMLNKCPALLGVRELKTYPLAFAVVSCVETLTTQEYQMYLLSLGGTGLPRLSLRFNILAYGSSRFKGKCRKGAR
jgi:hypothetical protein